MALTSTQRRVLQAMQGADPHGAGMTAAELADALYPTTARPHALRAAARRIHDLGSLVTGTIPWPGARLHYRITDMGHAELAMVDRPCVR